MASLDIWINPWERWADDGQSAIIVEAGDVTVSVDRDCAPILVTDLPLSKDAARTGGVEELGLVDGRRMAYAVSLPLRRDKGTDVRTERGVLKILMPQLPDAPRSDSSQIDDANASDEGVLFERLKCVWTRLKEVEEVLADPKHMWSNLAALWTDATTSRPKMDEIVRQARRMPPFVEKLDKAPRRILRRVHEQVMLSRVRELDRRSIGWLIRQPGDTIAEQAGDRQKIMAVAREENFDTLENRVLLAYARLARQTADDYAPRHIRQLKARHRAVRSFGNRCDKLARDLVERGVRLARPDVTPNFVLLNNPNYREVWDAWHRLLDHRKLWDELWPWQARSWEEFCTLAVLVALTQIEGSRPIATSPILFREEQSSGKWVDCINPLGVVHLDRQGLIVEVQYGYKSDAFRSWCSPLWLRVGRVDDANAFLRRMPIWPLWSVSGGLVEGECDSLRRIVSRTVSAKVGGAMVIRPAGEAADAQTRGEAACVALGATGDALRDGLELLRDVLVELVTGDSKP